MQMQSWSLHLILGKGWSCANNWPPRFVRLRPPGMIMYIMAPVVSSQEICFSSKARGMHCVLGFRSCRSALANIW